MAPRPPEVRPAAAFCHSGMGCGAAPRATIKAAAGSLPALECAPPPPPPWGAHSHRCTRRGLAWLPCVVLAYSTMLLYRPMRAVV
jgi:hypothetical protein